MHNPILVASLISWFLAQFLKIIITLIKDHRFNFVQLWASGGMPSSHSSTVCALAVSTGYVEGFSSPLFAIAAILAIVVMYDAAGVRRAVGEQAKILNQVSENVREGYDIDVPKKLKELIGHTPLQVFFGALLGIAVGVLFPLLLRVPFYAA